MVSGNLMSDTEWYVLSLFTELDRFVAKYPSLPAPVLATVTEVLYFQKPDRLLYEREAGGVFVGYVFVQVKIGGIRPLNRALRQAGLGEVLGYQEGVAQPLTQAEIDRVIEAMRSQKPDRFPVGARVRIKAGPYEGFDGVVSHVVGHVVRVKVQLRRTLSYAEISMDNLDLVA